MLVNQNEQNITKHVEFVSYDGKWPNLCHGLLTLKIDGKKVKFGSKYAYKDADYEKFWSSGGNCSIKCIEKDEWIINVQELPEEFRAYAAEIDSVFNENVQFGCCGGCR